MRSTFPRSVRRPVLSCAAALGTALALWACSDAIAPPSSSPSDQVQPNFSVNPGSCGVSFTAIVTDEDALLAAYGVPATIDTLFVCETWTGSDYVMHETTVGSAWNAWQDPDPSKTVAYVGGQITGYTAGGATVHAPVAAGPTSFDYMQVDAATRQASYDDPYHAVYSSGVGNCGGLACRLQAPTGGVTPSAQVVAGSDSGAGARTFTKHGLGRRGVRALAEGATEIGRSAQGHRRFRTQQGEAQVVLTLDAATELLIGEETTTAEGTTRATHRWKPGRRAGEYARERTEIERVERVNGRDLRSRTTIELLDVTIGSNVKPDSSPTPAPRIPR